MVWEAAVKFFKWAKGVYEGSKALQAITTVLQITSLVVGVKGFLQARQMLAKGQDILANKTSAGGKIPVIYGTRRVGAQVIYMDVSNNDSRHLFVVYALSVGECDEILGRTIELDGNPITDPKRFRYGCYVGSDRNGETGYSGHRALNTVSQVGSTISAGAGGFGTSSTSRYRITFNLHHGEPTQSADPMLVASMPNWTSSHKLNGVCYIAAHYKYDKEGMFAGVPQLTVQVKGKRVYDPRDNTQTFGTPSTYKHSSNPALCFLDLITNNEYGKGLTASQLNMSTFSSAATVCDTKVDQPYFNGTAQSVTWSANSGDNFFTITGTGANDIWWQNKVDEVISIYDQNGDDVLTNKEITDIQRTNFFDTNQEFVIFINDYFSSNYSSVGGSTLLKVKRFHCNGYLDTNKNVMDNAKELLANMRGVFLYVDGKYELQIEDTGTSTFTITDDHIISDAGISVDYGNKDKKANKVIVEFFNANKRYELDTATVLHDATPEYYSDDGDEVLEIKAEFPYVTDPYIAYNMAKAILTRSRNQTTMQFLGTPEMYKLNVGDIVTLAYTPLGFTGKISRVEALELQPNGLVAVSLIEYFDVYTWEVPPQEPVEEQSNPPSAYAVKKPTNLTFTDSNSSSTGRPILSWDAPTDYPDYEFRVNVVDSSGNQLINRIVNTTEAELNFTPTGNNYVASVTSLNTLGTESDPESITINVTTEPVAEGDIRANAITANKIDVNELSAISADMGTITAGSIDIGSGAFSVTSAGVLDATGATIGGSFSSGSGNSIFKADSDGIYLGNATFANAPFKVLNTGAVQTTLSFTAGVAGTDAVAKMSGSGDYRFWSGNETPANASFSVDKDGKAVARNLVLKLTDGTVYFDSETGFSSSAISQISAVTGTKVNTISSTFDADTEYEEITVTANTTVNLSVSIDTNFGGTYGSSTENTAIDEAEAKVPENFTLTIEHSSDGGSSYSTVVTDTFTRVNDRANPKTTPASDEYKINTFTDRLYISGGGGVIHLATTTTSFNLGCVDSDGRTVLSYTGLSLTGTTSGTAHRIRATVSTTDTSYDSTNNNVSSTAPRVVSVTDPSGNGFYVDDGSGSTVPPEGDITRVQITTAASSGLTGGANYTSGDALFTLALASSIDGAKTFTNNVVIQGDLDVQGTTTTIDTTNLDVKDKNITLNYSSGDSSANANGAGITIQDAVSAGNDATLTWNTSNDSFNFSHPVNVTGNVTADGLNLGTNEYITIGGAGEVQIFNDGSNTVLRSSDNLLIQRNTTPRSAISITDSSGEVQLHYGGSAKLATTSTGIDVTGNVTATAFYGDGSNLTGVTSTTINNNADNRIITGSGTANTLNAESNLTYDGTGLGIGTTSVSSGYLLHLKSTGDAAILLEADTDNVTETDNPRIQFSQDGGVVQGRIGYTGGANTFEVINQYNDSLILGQNNLARLTLTATDGLFDVNVNTTSGHGYQVASTTVIDSSRNLTNIGTINSGAITSTGDISGATIEGYTFPSFPSVSGYLLKSDTSGNLSWTANAISSYVDSGDDRVVTSTGSTGIQGEYGLTYNRTDGLQIHNYNGTGGLTSTATLTLGQSTNNSGISQLILDSQSQGSIRFKDGTTIDASISYNGVSPNKLSISCSNGISLSNDVTIQSTGSVGLTINADTDNVTESDVPYLSFKMDGSQERLRMGVDSANEPYISTDSDIGLPLNIKTGVANTIAMTFESNQNITIPTGNLTLTSGYVKTGLGSAASPALQVGDNDSGFYDSGANQIGVALAGADEYEFTRTYFDMMSNNLVNAGTISSSYFNSSSNIHSTGVAGLTVGGGRIGFDQSGTRSWTMGASSGYLNVFSGDGSGDFNLVSNVGLRQNGTLVLTAARNLINIGTISANATASSSAPKYTFTGDTDTGLGYITTNAVGLIAGGSRKFYVNATGAFFQNLSNGVDVTSLKVSGTQVIDSSRNLTNIGTVNSGTHFIDNGSQRVKYSVWSGTTYGIGMGTGYTFGGINNDYVLSHQMNDDSDRGFWWGDTGHSNAQGAMALTTDGYLTVANGIRVGYGESDTTHPSGGLQVDGTISSGAIVTSGDININKETPVLQVTDTSSSRNMLLFADDNNSVLRSSGQMLLQIGSQSALTIDASRHTTFAGNIIGNDIKAAGSGGLSLQTDEGTKRIEITDGGTVDIKNASLRIGTTTVIDSSRNLTNIGTITQTGTVSLNSYSTSDPDSTSRTRYPAGQMLTHYSEANGVSIIGGQGGYTGCSLTIGEETGRTSNFKLIRGISDTNGTPSEEFYIDGVGNATFAGTISSGAITSTGNITAYYSDERLKDFTGKIDNAIDKVKQLNGYYFKENKKAKELGYDNDKQQVGVNAQEVQKVLPEVIDIAPISHKEGVDEEYLTVHYEKLVPLLIEAIKDQQKQIDELKARLDNDS